MLLCWWFCHQHNNIACASALLGAAVQFTVFCWEGKEERRVSDFGGFAAKITDSHKERTPTAPW